jgi:hypothetical protein
MIVNVIYGSSHLKHVETVVKIAQKLLNYPIKTVEECQLKTNRKLLDRGQ